MTPVRGQRRSLGLLGAPAIWAFAHCANPSHATPAPSGSATVVRAAASGPAGSPPAASPSPTDDLVGKPAPDFTATAQDGSTVHVGALKGRPVVVYFYPKDETPGCTREACSFRDSWQAIAATGATLVGISADSLESHEAFATHHHLPFLLVSDPDGAIGQKYGVPFHGIHQRQTFVIGSDGTVKKVYRHVDVASHADQILADLKT